MFQQRRMLLLDQQFVAPNGLSRSKAERDKSLDALAASLAAMGGIASNRTDAKLDTTNFVPPAILTQIEALPSSEPFIVPLNGRMYRKRGDRARDGGISKRENHHRANAIRQQALQGSMEAAQAAASRRRSNIRSYAPASTKTAQVK
jgi:hypothetical protein